MSRMALTSRIQCAIRHHPAVTLASATLASTFAYANYVEYDAWRHSNRESSSSSLILPRRYDPDALSDHCLGKTPHIRHS
ncbi:hypothetical protein ACHAXA_009293 [Cyclostephanos tholiformis]|uniref:Secreted protein n=1 Tax=Cyclostephanos tholiformis TaxID=382380 RepID=A0ABD3RE52_9STRA